MQLSRIVGRWNIFAGYESGISLIETLVALAILSTVVITLLCGLATSSKAAFVADKQTTAESIARSQMEWMKNADYIYGGTGYLPAQIPVDKDYSDYSVLIAAEPLHEPDDGIQNITVTVKLSNREILRLEGYKVDR